MRLSSLCFLLAISAGLADGASAQPQASPPAAQLKDETSLRAWADRNLDQDGWVYYGFATTKDQAVLWFVADQSEPGSKYPIMREWVRSETAMAPGSRLGQVELDCAKRQMRSLAHVQYAGNNFRGAIVADGETGDAPWQPVTDRSIGDALLQRVCRDAR